jgi:hypothetical protein
VKEIINNWLAITYSRAYGLQFPVDALRLILKNLKDEQSRIN